MKYISFYQRYFPNLKTDAVRQNVLCPFHDDTEPSLSLDLETGLWYCHSCQKGGDIFQYYMDYHNCSFSKAKNDIMGNEQYEVLTDTETTDAHNRLLASENMQKILLVKRGWTLDTIKQYKLGWQQERVTIPVYDREDKLLNIRKYDLFHKTQQKFTGVKGYNQIRLFPISALHEELIVIFAGEPDTILARQYGINGITFTGGEGAFRQHLLPEFQDKKVYIVYDVDDKGRVSAQLLAKHLIKYAAEVSIVNLPEKLLPANGDFTDLVFYCADNNKELSELWNPCIELAIKVEKEPEVPEDKEYEAVDFYSAVKDEYYNRHIQLKGIAIGKNLSPYFTPRSITVKCNQTRGDSCKSCILFATGGEHTIEISEESALDLIKCTKLEQKTKIRNLIGIRQCNQFEMEMETQTIEEIFISPVIDSERIDRQFILRKVYTKGHNIQLNKTYNFLGKTTSDPKTQEATHLFEKQQAELSDLETFQLSELDKETLKIFQPENNTTESIDDKINEICKDLTYNVPEVIIGRENLIFAYDLAFHSVLSFKFAGSKVNRGLIELLALGDTRTGKTKTAIKLCQHYRAGEYITLETATLPGLIGGISQVGRDVTFSWGVLPINDGRMVILDEVNGISTKDISDLSTIRDTGIAERTVVGSTRKTLSRVRLIWLSNPRSAGRRIESYSSGVESIKELFGRAEDIARIDFAIIVAKQDVGSEAINVRYYPKVEHIFTSEICNRLLLWAWSRKERDIEWGRGTERAILDYTIEMSKKYTDVIPLVQASVQRIKLAKLSVALACRLFSTEDGEKVIVRPEHVEYIVNFLYKTYDSKYFGYSDYSTYRKEAEELTEMEELQKMIEGMENPNQFINKMLISDTIVFEDLMDFANFGREKAKYLRGMLVNDHCLNRIKSFYVKTPSFVTFLKDLLEKRRTKNERI